MLTVKPLSEAISIARAHFGTLRTASEVVPIEQALLRALAEDIRSSEFIPGFDRSTVDGYAVKSTDVFGCSDTIPALLMLAGVVEMGQHAGFSIAQGQCAGVPTGGEVPAGADTMVMLEHTEDLGGGQIAIYKPSAPGTNMIMRGEDTKPGQVLLPAGRRINAADSGTLAALGITTVPVMRSPRVAIISTGDELVPTGEKPGAGQIRDVNAPMLYNAVREAGGTPQILGIIRDQEEEVTAAVKAAVAQHDMLILSGGTSVGEKDAMPRVINNLGEMLVHGLAIKPGKPTLFGQIAGKPVFGLPGNPVAAFFIFYHLVRPILFSMQGATVTDSRVTLPVSRSVPSNHGREEIVPVMIHEGRVEPVPSKSGLITTLACTDGFIRIPRELEGLKQGDLVEVTLFSR